MKSEGKEAGTDGEQDSDNRKPAIPVAPNKPVRYKKQVYKPAYGEKQACKTTWPAFARIQVRQIAGEKQE
jgi:hypothetical protein